jgi:LacI family transcriptional regulator
MSKSGGPRNVAIAFPVAVPWLALFMQGVRDYADRHGGWTFTTSPPTVAGTQEVVHTVLPLRGWPGDGLIAAVGNRAEARAARRLGIPVVNLAGALRDAGLPRVMVDHYTIGQMAAEHLLERGLRRLAYFGTRGLWYSQRRGEGFADRARQAGVRCDVFESPSVTSPRATWQEWVAPLDDWLRGLQTPIGVLAIHDYRARVIAEECLRLGIDVPHDMAVIGVDNDPIVCEYCRPTLSSVSRSAWRTGYEAAALLDRLMQGKDAPREDLLVPPDGVVARQSTDTVAVDDPHVAAAVHYMIDHVGDRFGIQQVMHHVPVSRRQLELRFRRALGCTPYDYLCRVRVERAKQLLAAGKRTKMQNIAAACGFSTMERLRLVFQRLTGQTPQQYRRAAGREGRA